MRLHSFEIDRVAQLAGCTSRTVSNYFKDASRMKPRVRARVEDALRQLGLLNALRPEAAVTAQGSKA